MSSHLDSTGFAGGLRHLFRRPSTQFLLGAGLLAADRLRWLPTAWTGATHVLAATLLTLGLWLLLRHRARTPRHRREVEVLVLPLSHAIEPDTRWRIVAFALFIAALVVVPAVFAS